MRPIAGTRKRGSTPQKDKQMELELLGCLKERSEHVMLVDLGRNDVNRVSVSDVRYFDKLIVRYVIIDGGIYSQYRY